jgi:hypothetical protein
LEAGIGQSASDGHGLAERRADASFNGRRPVKEISAVTVRPFWRRHMMTTRRTLFVFGALLAVGVLLAPQAAFAQTAVTGLTATASEDEASVTVSWTVTDTTDDAWLAYIEGAIDPFPVATPATVVVPAADTPANTMTHSYTFTGLKYGQLYTFGIREVSSGGVASTAWQAAQATTMDAPPRPAPTVTELAAVGRDQIRISWSHGRTANNQPDTNRLRYEVGWTDAAGVELFDDMVTPQTVVVIPDRSATTYTLQNLAVDKDFLVAVRSVGGDVNGNVTGKSAWQYRSPERQRTPAAPNQPQNVEVTGGNGYLTVTWRRDANANNYLVEWRGRNQSFDNPDRQKMVPQPDASAGSTIETMIMDLDNGTEYGVIVKSRNERGPSTTNNSETSSSSSIEAKAMPMADMLDTPSPVEAVAMDMAVEVKWTAVEGATGYRVQWRTASQSYDPSRQEDGFYQYRTGDLALSHVVDDLENGMEYMFRVIAMGEGGAMSNPSDEVSAMPMMPTPALPVVGALLLGAGLVAAGRRRLRARRQPRLLKA